MLNKLTFKLLENCRRRNLNLFSRFFYDSRTKNDTIFAPLTSIQCIKGSPLGVIRVSGSKTEYILEKLTEFKKILRIEDRNLHLKENNKSIVPRKASLSKIYNPLNGTNELLDIGLVLWFPKPHSYTGEDSCEFHIHGSQSIQSTLLSVLGSIPGLRPAEPGEFTRRSVLNGKMSLLQAESLPDLISSNSDYQRRLALKGLSGSTRNKYDDWISNLVGILAHLEASIDFGEDELIGEREVVDNCIKKIAILRDEISDFIQYSSQSRNFIQNGARIAILGKPNAGKSTFMNILCKKDKSIVSDFSGTTRDVVEHSFELGGHAITLCDTAGLRDFESSETTNIDNIDKEILQKHVTIEKEGIKRAIDTACNADIIIYLIEATNLDNCDCDEIASRISTEIENFKRSLEKIPKYLYVLINKIDLIERNKESISCDKLSYKIKLNYFPKDEFNLKIDLISCKNGENLKQFSSNLIKNLDNLAFSRLDKNSMTPTENYNQLDYVNERHLSLLKSTQRHLNRASKLNLDTIDEMAQHVRESLDYLSRIVGSVTNEDVIDVIFRDFCIGK